MRNGGRACGETHIYGTANRAHRPLSRAGAHRRNRSRCVRQREGEREREGEEREKEREAARERAREREGAGRIGRARRETKYERLRGLRDCTGRSWRPHSFWSNLGAVRAFTLRHCPGGEKRARIQAETLPTRVRSCLSDFESAVAGGKYLSVSSGREGGPFRTRTRTAAVRA